MLQTLDLAMLVPLPMAGAHLATAPTALVPRASGSVQLSGERHHLPGLMGGTRLECRSLGVPAAQHPRTWFGRGARG